MCNFAECSYLERGRKLHFIRPGYLMSEPVSAPQDIYQDFSQAGNDAEPSRKK
jgi:hypothetical protein